MKKLLLSIMLMATFAHAEYNATGTDYSLAATETWVAEDSLESLGIANEILGILSQTQLDQFVNKGIYVAEMQPPRIEHPDDTTRHKMFLDVTRANNQSNMVVKFWLLLNDTDHQLVRATIEVEEGVSTNYPKGKFKMHYSVHAPLDDYSAFTDDWNQSAFDYATPVGEGIFQVDEGNYIGQAKIYHKEFYDDGSWAANAAIDMTMNVTDINISGGTSAEEQQGYAYGTSFYDDRNGEIDDGNGTAAKLLIGTNHLLIDDNVTVTVKDKNNPYYTCYRYGLYDENGTKVSLADDVDWLDINITHTTANDMNGNGEANSTDPYTLRYYADVIYAWYYDNAQEEARALNFKSGTFDDTNHYVVKCLGRSLAFDENDTLVPSNVQDVNASLFEVDGVFPDLNESIFTDISTETPVVSDIGILPASDMSPSVIDGECVNAGCAITAN
jgi:hypothetical protein